ncbi:MAG: hypothetical protein V4520_16065 [Bacteroidota bacterium]
MKNLAVALLCFAFSFKASAQDTVNYQNLPAYKGRKITIVMPVEDFDLRKEFIYLYMGNRYPNQKFTVIVNRKNGDKRIKLKNDVILGRVMVSLTGYITTYDGEPDTTENYDYSAIKKEYEKDRPMVFLASNTPVMVHTTYSPRTGPIDLRGRLVMVISDQKQIGPSYQLPQRSSDSLFPNFNPTDTEQ